MNPHIWWYLARATGIVAWAGAVGAVLAGLALATRAGQGKVPPSWMLALHRHLGALTVAFIGAHVGALVADSYVSFGPLDILVPMHAGWRPGALAWGVVAMWAILLVELTSLVKRRLSPRLWRSIHLTSYIAAVASTVHLLTAGTDAKNAALRWGLVVVMSVASGFVSFRLILPKRRKPGSRPASQRAVLTSPGST
jgi:DMSO/TMAO reductase YedYZ heme-binding membrane subunit